MVKFLSLSAAALLLVGFAVVNPLYAGGCCGSAAKVTSPAPETATEVASEKAPASCGAVAKTDGDKSGDKATCGAGGCCGTADAESQEGEKVAQADD